MNQDVEILSVQIISKNSDNIKIDYRSIEYLYFIEDIYSLCITGRLSFYDRTGVFDNFGIGGNEIVNINFGNIGEGKFTKNIRFNIYSVNKITPTKTTTLYDDSRVELILVDESYNYWHNTRWYKSWNKPNVSILNVNNIVDDIMRYVGSTIVDKELISTNISNFDMHSRTAAECMKWILTRSRSSLGNFGYLLYKTAKNKKFYTYTLTTLEKLLQSNEYIKPYDDKGLCEYVFNTNNVEYRNKIKYVDIKKPSNNSLRQLLGGKVLGNNSLTKTLISRSYTYMDALNKFTILGKYTLFPSNLLSEDAGATVDVDGTDDKDIADNIWYGRWIKEYCNQNTVHIVVTGHQDRYVGGKIKINWPSTKGTDNNLSKTEDINRQYTGDYLVKTLTHFFSPSVETGWIQKMVLIKNGYDDSPVGNMLVKSVKTNSKSNLKG